ncbi:MAG: hypothetical protein KDK91_29200 [Gammaproteobacteria bacterium]|nr:hypothetical protein [Gammaproteobacteria bacterium]
MQASGSAPEKGRGWSCECPTDRSEQQARHSLNQSLAAIRKLGRAHGVELIDSDSQRVTLHGAGISSDIAELRSALQSAPAEVGERYTGHLLDQLLVSEPMFETWLQGVRAELSDAVCVSLAESARGAETRGELDHALTLYRRLVAVDPLRESAQRQIIRLLSECGDRAAALRHFTVFSQLLREALQMDPDAQTLALVEEIRRVAHDAPPPAPVEAAAATIDVDGPLMMSDPIALMPGAELFPPVRDAEGSFASRPTIAVMPFRSIGADTGQGYLCEGISEDLIFSLSAFQWFSVLGRGSSFQFREQDIDPRRIGAYLGARYVVDGSVRRDGRQLRISVSLLETESGHQLWAQRYAREVEALFDVHDDMVKQIVAAVELQIDGIEMQRALSKPSTRLDVYDHVLRGNWLVNQSGPERLSEAVAHFERAMALDPNYAPAYAGRAFSRYKQAWMDFTDIRYDHLRAAHEDALLSLGLAPDNPRALRYLATTNAYLGHQQEGVEAATRAVEICPSYATGYSGLAFTLDLVGRFEEALPAVEETIRLRPFDRVLSRCIISKAIAQYQTGDYAGAERVVRLSQQIEPNWSLSNVLLLAVLGQLGDRDRADEQVRKLVQLHPEATLERMSKALPFAVSDYQAHFEEGIKKAGWD